MTDEWGRSLVKTLRRYIKDGVPYQKQGVNPDFGLDCIGAIVSAARDNGVSIDEPENWKSTGTGKAFGTALRKYCKRVSLKDLREGDLVEMGRAGVTHAGVACWRMNGWGLLHCDGYGMHESAFEVSLKPGQGNATAPVRSVWRIRPEWVE